jgi:cytochrome c
MPRRTEKTQTAFLSICILAVSAAVVTLRAAEQASADPQAGAPAAGASSLVGDADAGAEIYRSVCRECHGGSLAPPLRGVVGRQIASVADFDYSDGLLAKKSMTWTQANLDAFLTSPQEFAPGTEMKKSIADAQSRADMIVYLASLPPLK